MGKITGFIFLLLFSVSLISAVTIYSGEPIVIQLEKQYEYYSVVGNSTEIVLNITQDENNNVTIIPDKYSESDSYEVIFFDIEKEVITVYTGGGGSSGERTIYKDRNITEYQDVVVTEYMEKDVPGETTEIEKIIRRTPWIVWGIMALLLILVIYLMFFRKEEIDERGFEKYEQKETPSF